MKPEQGWTCGQCGARVAAPVGAIARAFKAPLLTCPALARRRLGPARRPRDRGPQAPRGGRRRADTTTDTVA
jgi:hypothetical protein